MILTGASMSTAEQEEERTGCQAVSLVLHDASQNTTETKEKRFLFLDLIITQTEASIYYQGKNKDTTI